MLIPFSARGCTLLIRMQRCCIPWLTSQGPRDLEIIGPIVTGVSTEVQRGEDLGQTCTAWKEPSRD